MGANSFVCHLFTFQLCRLGRDHFNLIIYCISNVNISIVVFNLMSIFSSDFVLILLESFHQYRLDLLHLQGLPFIRASACCKAGFLLFIWTMPLVKHKKNCLELSVWCTI